jgi:hypothetical protein
LRLIGLVRKTLCAVIARAGIGLRPRMLGRGIARSARRLARAAIGLRLEVRRLIALRGSGLQIGKARSRRWSGLWRLLDGLRCERVLEGLRSRLARLVGAKGRLWRLWRLRGWSARYRRIARHLREDGTVSPEDRALSGDRLPWPTRSLYHEGYLALLRAECIGAPSLGRSARTLPVGEI